MKRTEMLENAKRITNYWHKGYTDKCIGNPQGYSIYGEPTTEEKDAYTAVWDEAEEFEIRSDK